MFVWIGSTNVLNFSLTTKFHRAQCKIEDPFSAGRLASSPLTTFTFVDINDLSMRINLQHRGCLPLAAIGEKRIIY